MGKTDSAQTSAVVQSAREVLGFWFMKEFMQRVGNHRRFSSKLANLLDTVLDGFEKGSPQR